MRYPPKKPTLHAIKKKRFWCLNLLIEKQRTYGHVLRVNLIVIKRQINEKYIGLYFRKIYLDIGYFIFHTKFEIS